MVFDVVILSLAIVNLKFEIENWLAYNNWSPIVIKLHPQYEIPICHALAQLKTESRQSWKGCAVRDDVT